MEHPVLRLDTISETESFKKPLAPLTASESERPAATSNRSSGVEDESGDQDPSVVDGGDEYARAYSAIQARKFAAAVKAAQAQSEASESPDSFSSDCSDAMIFKTSIASEPLYGDPGEEEFWQSEKEATCEHCKGFVRK